MNAFIVRSGLQEEMLGATTTTDGVEGLVPAPTKSDADKFLRGDGTWSPSGSGDCLYYGSAVISENSDVVNHDVTLDNGNAFDYRTLLICFTGFYGGSVCSIRVAPTTTMNAVFGSNYSGTSSDFRNRIYTYNYDVTISNDGKKLTFAVVTRYALQIASTVQVASGIPTVRIGAIYGFK